MTATWAATARVWREVSARATPAKLETESLAASAAEAKQVRSTLVALGLIRRDGSTTLDWRRAAKEGLKGLANATEGTYPELTGAILSGAAATDFERRLQDVVGDRPPSATKRLRSFVLGAVAVLDPDVDLGPYRGRRQPAFTPPSVEQLAASVADDAASTEGRARAARLVEEEHRSLLGLLERGALPPDLTSRQILGRTRRLRDELRREI